MEPIEVELFDLSEEVKGALGRAAAKWLYESALAIEAQVKQNSAEGDTHQLKPSWEHTIDKSKGEAKVGSRLENAIWEEFGTGEYALDPKDRSNGYWVYVKGGGSTNKKSRKRYSLAQAKRIMAILRKKGLDAYYTNGKRPRRALHKAFETKKPAIIRRAQQLIRSEMEK